MPNAVTSSYSQAPLKPYKWPERVILEDYPVAANQVILLGNVVAQVTAANAIDVQTLTNTGTGGTFTLQFGNALQYVTTPLACTTLTAAQLQAALQALPNIGSGGVTVTGGPFTSGGGTLTITFAGNLANQPQPLLVINNGSATGGSVTVAHTTQGVANGALVNYVGTLVANPTSAPTLTPTGSDGTIPAGTYVVQYTFVNAAGETLPSPAAAVIVASTNHIAVTSITGIPATVTSVNVYINGAFAKNQAVTSNATGAFSILAFSASAGLDYPLVSSAFVNSDGSQIPVGLAWYTMSASPSGIITFGNTAPTGNEFQPQLYTGNAAIFGWFSTNTINSGSGPDAYTANLLGRIVSGSLSNGVLAMN